MMAAASVAELLPSMKRLRIRESLKQFAAPLQEQVQDGSSCLPACAKEPNVSGSLSYQPRAANISHCLPKVDLAQEGRHLWQFNYNFRKQPHVRFPYPIYPLVSPEVRVLLS